MSICLSHHKMKCLHNRHLNRCHQNEKASFILRNWTGWRNSCANCFYILTISIVPSLCSYQAYLLMRDLEMLCLHIITITWMLPRISCTLIDSKRYLQLAKIMILTIHPLYPIPFPPTWLKTLSINDIHINNLNGR